jgi:branched-chain amino acid transport system substrate-binding protein
VFATKDFNSVVGKFSIDENGDTTITTMSGSRVQNDKFQFVTLLGGG